MFVERNVPTRVEMIRGKSLATSDAEINPMVMVFRRYLDGYVLVEQKNIGHVSSQLCRAGPP